MLESFDQAARRLQKFLKENGRPSRIAWLQPNDIVLSGGREVYVKLPIPAENEKRANRQFDIGMDLARGVLLKGLFEIADATCSYVWFPINDFEAESALIGPGVKLSFLTGEFRPIGIPVQSRLRWLYLRIRHHRKRRFKHELLGA